MDVFATILYASSIVISFIFIVINLLSCISALDQDETNDNFKQQLSRLAFSIYIFILSFCPVYNNFTNQRFIDRGITLGEIVYTPSGELSMSDNVHYLIFGTSGNVNR